MRPFRRQYFKSAQFIASTKEDLSKVGTMFAARTRETTRFLKVERHLTDIESAGLKTIYNT